MSENPTTLPRRATGAVPGALYEVIGRTARDIDAATNGQAVRQVEALRGFAEYVRSRGLDDPRIYALSKIAVGFGNSDRYDPPAGGNQVTLLARLASSSAPTPLPDVTLNELVSAAIDDLLLHVAQERASFEKERDEAVSELPDAQRAVEAAEAAKAELRQACDERDAANAALAEKEAQLAILRTREAAGPAEAAKARPRRIRVPGDHVGIYAKPDASGELPPEGERLFEIGWIDQDGKQRWRVIGPDLEEAIAERAALTNPEKVAA